MKLSIKFKLSIVKQVVMHHLRQAREDIKAEIKDWEQGDLIED